MLWYLRILELSARALSLQVPLQTGARTCLESHLETNFYHKRLQ